MERVVGGLVGGAAIGVGVAAPPPTWRVSEQPADLVEGLGLAGLLVEPGAAADHGTADDGTGPESSCGPPIADADPVHGGADDGGAAVVGQVVVGGGDGSSG
jgi:hypothetical protein